MEIVQFASLIGLICVFAGMIAMVAQQPGSHRDPRSGLGGIFCKLLARFTQAR